MPVKEKGWGAGRQRGVRLAAAGKTQPQAPRVSRSHYEQGPSRAHPLVFGVQVCLHLVTPDCCRSQMASMLPQPRAACVPHTRYMCHLSPRRKQNVTSVCSRACTVSSVVVFKQDSVRTACGAPFSPSLQPPRCSPHQAMLVLLTEGDLWAPGPRDVQSPTGEGKPVPLGVRLCPVRCFSGAKSWFPPRGQRHLSSNGE